MRIINVEDYVHPLRKISKVYFHCSAYLGKDFMGLNLAEQIEKWHLARGFSEIGYHFVIDLEGTLIEGRSLEKIPAAQAGHNSGSIAICLDGLKKTDFTQEQFRTLNKLVDKIHSVDNTITFHGHCEVDPNKSCPVFDYTLVCGLNYKGEKTYLGGYTNTKPMVKHDNVDTNGYNASNLPPTVSLSSSGKVVELLQSKLGNINIDGEFGQNTFRRVTEFQLANGLTPDGVVGEKTWSILFNS